MRPAAEMVARWAGDGAETGMHNSDEKWMILGGVALVGALIVVAGVLQRRKTDPLAQASKLIAHCNEKMSEIEQSLAGLRSVVQAA